MAIAICGDVGSLEEVLETYLFDSQYGTEDSAKYMHELLLEVSQSASANEGIREEKSMTKGMSLAEALNGGQYAVTRRGLGGRITLICDVLYFNGDKQHTMRAEDA